MLVSLIFSATLPAFGARWYEDYENAVAKVEDAQCSSEAIESLGAAVVDKPKPQRGKKTYAQRRIDYLPYLFLARAHLLCGNLQLARQYLEKSRSFGVAPLADIDHIESTIKRRESAATPQPTPTEGIDPRVLQERYDSAETALKNAETALADLGDRISSAGSIPETVSASWRNQQSSLQEEIRSLRQTTEEAHQAEDLLSLADVGTHATSITLKISSLRRDINAEVSRQEERILAQQASPTPLAPSPHPRRTLMPQVSPQPQMGRETELPDKLYRGAAAYFSGDYEGVLTYLQTIDTSDERIMAASLLLRGAGRFNLSRLAAPEEAKELLRLAKADLSRVRALTPEMEADPALFSPPLIKLFNSLSGLAK